jgi:RHS repeat-associated protein
VTATGAGTTYTYDSNGNLTQKTEGTDTWVYEWNARNELTRVLKNSVEQARFAYDPLGRRVEKVTGGVTTSYTYDGEDVLRELRAATTVRYIHGPDIDEPLAVDDDGTLSYFHVDGLGSIVRRTNAAGTVTLVREYDSWGNLDLGTSEPSYAFTGREWDPEVALYHYRARYYDPTSGRLISEDPLGLSAGPGLYAYVDGNPVGLIDPFGLAAGAIGDPEHCAELLRQIEKLVRDLMVRQLERIWPRFTLSPAAEEGHRQQWNERKKELRKWMRRYKNRGCGDPPDGAQRMCREPYPEPQFTPVYPFPPPQSQREAAAAGAAGTTMFLLLMFLVFAM